MFRRLQYAAQASVSTYSLAGCLAALVHHSCAENPGSTINFWGSTPDTVSNYTDVIYAMIIGASKVWTFKILLK